MDVAYISVKNFFVVVVFNLHDPVMQTVGQSASPQQNLCWVDGILQHEIQVGRSDDAPLHGSQHLDGRRGDVIGFGQSPFH